MPSVVSPVLIPPAKLSKLAGESINSLDRKAKGPQVAGGNKTPSFKHFFLFSSNPVLSWQHLVPPELNFISNLELTNAFFSWKCFPSAMLMDHVFAWKSAFLQDSCQLFYGQDDSPCANAISRCMLWVRDLVPLPQF